MPYFGNCFIFRATAWISLSLPTFVRLPCDFVCQHERGERVEVEEGASQVGLEWRAWLHSAAKVRRQTRQTEAAAAAASECQVQT